MIRINLLDEKPDLTGVYIAQGLTMVCALVLTLVACTVVQVTTVSQRDSRIQNEATLKQALERLKSKTKKVEDLQKKEQLLRKKINAIKSVKAKKQVPVRVLDTLAQRIPRRLWLQGISDSGGTLQVEGVAVDNQTVSNFILDLDRSPYMANFNLSYTEEFPYGGVKLVSFQFQASLQNYAKTKKIIEEERRERRERAAKTAQLKEAAAGMDMMGDMSGANDVAKGL